MDGLMQRTPLLVTNILDYAAKWHAEQEMVTQTVSSQRMMDRAGPKQRGVYRCQLLLHRWRALVHRYTYKESRQRAQLCALALRELGVK